MALAVSTMAFNYVADTSGTWWGIQDAASPVVDTGSLKTACSQALHGLPDGLVDASQSFITRQAVIGGHQIKIDRKAWHVTDEQIDRRATFKGKRVVHKNERCDLGQQACGIKIRLVHGLSTSSPSAERDTQARSLPVGSWAASSLVAPGKASSRACCSGWRTPTSLCTSRSARSGVETRGAPSRFSNGPA